MYGAPEYLFVFKDLFLFYVYECLPACLCVLYGCVLCTLRPAEMVRLPRNELERVVHHHVLGIEPGSSGRTTSPLNW